MAKAKAKSKSSNSKPGSKSTTTKALVELDESHCSPLGHTYFKASGSCLPAKHLRQIAELYNATCAVGRSSSGSAKCTEPIPRSAFGSVAGLKKALEKALGPTCRDNDAARCLIDHPAVRANNNPLHAHLRNLYFRPDMPASWRKNPREWLNTFDILKVMSQYEVKYTKFKFLGVHPLDFKLRTQHSQQCVVPQTDMCKFNVLDFLSAAAAAPGSNNNPSQQARKNAIGMVINLDTHDKSGSHWVALYACFNPRSKRFGVCYYDSAGQAPPAPVRDFMQEIYEDSRRLFNEIGMSPEVFQRKFKVVYNNIQHQFKNTECGMFSMIFLILCIEDMSHRKSFDDLLGSFRKHFDDNIFAHRKMLYS